ncbi:permease [Paenibacillus selenitireducens]|uniref:Permease n=1 Tax=Paenibacillus selenitireducens TaxID=1324314 RepID=A0A1T2WZD4_9BACL|nr:permease [Paenibacillus selenitireducens]OPA72984.1 permease [Paenibacillus selenitireducens]
MFAGHFGLAAAVKSKAPQIPLWALMLSTQLLDVVFIPFLLTGKETMEPISGETGYGANMIHADYTHSLIGALFIAMIAGWGAWRLWGRRGGVITLSVVFSHWILDLLVHRSDLPILPENFGNLPLLGFGLWKYPVISITLEIILLVSGIILYYRSFSRINEHRQGRRWVIASTVLMGFMFLMAIATDVFNLSLD